VGKLCVYPVGMKKRKDLTYLTHITLYLPQHKTRASKGQEEPEMGMLSASVIRGAPPLGGRGVLF